MNESEPTKENRETNSTKEKLEVVSALIGIGATGLALITQFIGFFDKYENAAEILLIIGVVSLIFYFGNYAWKNQGKSRLAGITVIVLVAVLGYFVWAKYINMPDEARKEIDRGDVALRYGYPQRAIEHYQNALVLAPKRRVITNKLNEAKAALDKRQEDLRKRQQENK